MKRESKPVTVPETRPKTSIDRKDGLTRTAAVTTRRLWPSQIRSYQSRGTCTVANSAR
jgi:hypothetical protein